MARCPDCIHFSLCDYNTNIAGDTKIKLYYDEGAEKCSFYKPTADVEEVKHGYWDEDGRCSNCDWYMPFDCDGNAFEADFCHICGAKMDLKGEIHNG